MFILIESQWNLNFVLIAYLNAAVCDINRITVEFKFVSAVAVKLGYTILIESQWNLNQGRALQNFSEENILIESQWNLNIAGAMAITDNKNILIESQWNLNKNLHTKMGKLVIY